NRCTGTYHAFLFISAKFKRRISPTPLIIPLNILFLYIGRTKHLRIDLDLGTVNFQTISLHSLGNFSPFNDWVPITRSEERRVGKECSPERRRRGQTRSAQ